jgi:hypothetical protein
VARVQALLVLAQSLPLLVLVPALGVGADVLGPRAVLACCAAVLAAAAGAALRARRMGGEPGRRPA